MRRSRMTLAVSATAIAAGLLLSGCTANDGLAQQYRAGSGQNYIAGDGSVIEFAAANRGEAVSFDGTLAD